MFKRYLLIVIFVMTTSTGFAGTGFLKGERTSGLNKICFYEGPSGGFSKTVGSANLCPLSADDGRSPAVGSSGFGSDPYQQQRPISNTGFLSGERTSGLNKICYYDSPRGTFTKTIGSVQLCPLSAKQ